MYNNPYAKQDNLEVKTSIFAVKLISKTLDSEKFAPHNKVIK